MNIENISVKPLHAKLSSSSSKLQEVKGAGGAAGGGGASFMAATPAGKERGMSSGQKHTHSTGATSATEDVPFDREADKQYYDESNLEARLALKSPKKKDSFASGNTSPTDPYTVSPVPKTESTKTQKEKKDKKGGSSKTRRRKRKFKKARRITKRRNQKE